MPRRREFNGIARAIADSFASRNNDVDGYWALGKLYLGAQQLNVLKVSITLVPSEVMPTSEPLATIARKYKLLLASLMEKHRLAASWLACASVSIEFESSTAKPRVRGIHAGGQPFECRVLLTDDLLREHTASSVGWCWPHDAARESQSARICGQVG